MPKMALYRNSSVTAIFLKRWFELGFAGKKTPHRRSGAAVGTNDLNQIDQNVICTPAMKVRAAPGTTMFSFTEPV